MVDRLESIGPTRSQEVQVPAEEVDSEVDSEAGEVDREAEASGSRERRFRTMRTSPSISTN